MSDLRKLVFKKTKPVVTSSSSEESLPRSLKTNEKKPDIEEIDIKLSTKSKFLHLKDYLIYYCEDCNFKSKKGEEFELHLSHHDEDTFCDEIDEEFEKTASKKKKAETTFQLSSIMEESAKESQDLLDGNVSE